ncbi:MAG: DNA gyrase subunit A [Fusobacteriaceae bacterium]
MRKKNKSSHNGGLDMTLDDYLQTKNLIEVSAGDNCTEAMTTFMINNNLQRMIPDFKDGLKPVHRRILQTMFEEGTRYSYEKVSTLAGATVRIHPHGDVSIGSSIVSLAQDWKNQLCFIDGKGNYGNVQGDGAAASRYIKAKLSKFAWDCFFEEFSKFPKIVDYNYRTGLPEYLPSKYPVIFLNGSLGIGSGYKTDIPPFNFKEICELTIKLIANPERKFEIYPDMPVQCDILDKEKFHDIFIEGRGSFRMRGHAEIEDGAIRIKSVPYNVASDKITEQIKNLVLNKSITTITDLKNFTLNNKVDLFLPLTKGADAHKTLEQLYKYTSLQSSFSLSFAVLDGLEFLTDMKDVIRNTLLRWVAFREFTVIRKIQLELKELNTRMHILEALIMMLTHKNYKEIMDKVRQVKGGKEAVIEFYVTQFKITDYQARNIAQMAIYELSYDYLPKYKDEFYSRLGRRNEIKDIVMGNKIKDLIVKDLKEGIEKYGAPRKCAVLSRKDELGLDDTSHTFMVTHGGYMKKLKDVKDVEFGFYDKVDGRLDYMTVAKTDVNNLDDIHLFTKLGKIYRFPIYQIPECLKANSGILVKNYCKLSEDDVVIAAYTTTELETNRMLYFVTNTACAKKIDTKEFVGTNSVTTAKIRKGEELVAVEISPNVNSVAYIYTTNQMKRCSKNDIPELSRAAQGKEMLSGAFDVRGIAVGDQSSMLVIDERNNCKVMNLEGFPEFKKSGSLTITSCNTNSISKCFTVTKRGKYDLVTSSGVKPFETSWFDSSTRMSRPSEKLAQVRDIILGLECV